MPPLPITHGAYRCSKQFLVDDLEPLFATHQKLGVIVVGGECATVWTREHTSFNKLREFTCHRQKHMKCGGQSANRFSHSRLNQIDEFVGKICEETAKLLPPDTVRDIVVAGNGELFERVAADPAFVSRVRQVIRTDSLEINDIAVRINVTAGDADSRKTVDRMFDALDAGDPCILYGHDIILQALRSHVVAEVVATDGIASSLSLADAGGVAVTTVVAHTRLAAMGGILARTYFPWGGDEHTGDTM